MIAQVLCLVALVAVANAGYIGHLGGSSVGSRKQDDFGNYAFNYQIVDHKGATNGRSEVGDGHGNKKGSYNIGDIDGRARRVDYVADGHGFRAVVKTNEPGTKTSLPAAAVYNTPFAGFPSGGYAHGPAVVAAPVAYGGGYGYGGYGKY